MAATRHSRPHRALAVLAPLAVLAACSNAAPPPDRLELATIPRWREVPKSTPAQLVGAFDRFCTDRTPGMAAQDARLRAAGYIPKVRASAGRPALYVVDDRRPAVAVSDRICAVRAVARTGQRERVDRYVAATFPAARPLARDGLSRDVEQAWTIEGGIIATTRNLWAGNVTTYTVTLFTPDSRDG
ncbi:MAG: hypothetical protein K8F31_04950, partial [Roseovarius sp.]|nr:hypothetical protein [Roseovarius sp.]